VIRHLIFDLDGTLLDSCGPYVAILNAMLAERQSSYRIDPVGARPYMSGGGLHLVTGLLGAHCVDPDADLADFRARLVASPTLPSALFEGVAEGVAALHAGGFRLAICSNKPQHLCEKVLADVGLAEHFDVIVGSRDGLRPKPAPDLLQAVLDGFGCAAGECLYVGDSDLDHDVAEAFGMPFHFMTYGYAEPGWAPRLGERHNSFAMLVAAIRARTGVCDA
jgi:phosphoglycolate phosphatase